MILSSATIQKYILLIFLVTGFCSCKKFVQVSPPNNQLETGMIFSSDQTAVEAMIGVYSRAMAFSGYPLNGGMSLYPGLSSDEIFPTISVQATDAFFSNALASTNPDISTLYSSAYTTIYNANNLLQNLGSSPAITDSIKKQLSGEAAFVRALIYFCMVNLFGEVPLITTTDYKVNAVAPRATVADIYQQIISDLLNAQNLLPVVYASTKADPGDRTRPNKWAATGLLARVYLYQQRWVDAEAAASAVIGGGDYRLEDLDSVFLSTSKEAILQLQPVSSTINTAEGSYFLPPDDAAAKPAYALTAVLAGAFEPGDGRKQHWTGVKIISGTAYSYSSKYKIRTGGYPYGEYEMVLRLAEQYLIRAEARAQQGSFEAAVNDLDTLRYRAGLPGLSIPLTPASLLAAVAQERRVELFTEFGHRWLDLKRTGNANAVLGQEKTTWQANAVLYPIPLHELQLNSALTQNVGY
jgi:hypothetical protein